MLNYLISGSSTGLGRFLSEELNAQKLDRTLQNVATDIYKDIDIIIHCAWSKDLFLGKQYIDEAISLVNNLLNIPHKKFIFLSSIDIYSKNQIFYSENAPIDIREITGIYGMTKYLVEEEIKKYKQNHLILRPSCLLGKYTSNNTIVKLSKNQPINISLESKYNFITYNQIKQFIINSTYFDWVGCYNIVASDNIQLKDINNTVQDGHYQYDCNKLSFSKLFSSMNSIIKTSLENYNKWIKNDS